MIAKRTGRPIQSIKDDEYNAVVLHGEMLDKLTDDDWESILDKEEIIFARTSPKHKLSIVKRCQARGHIVGVTGDGVNDSPALKTSDLGISMNISGSDVSKEAAAMILLDDNFASTVAGISEGTFQSWVALLIITFHPLTIHFPFTGRLIFQNLKKSVKYTLTHIMPEVLANLVYLVAQIPNPLNALQIIVIDMGFELFVALTYAWEVPESIQNGLMAQIPRKPVTPRSIDLLRRDNAVEEKKRKEIDACVYGKEHRFAQTESQDLDGEATHGNRLLDIKYFFAHVRYWFAHLFDLEEWRLWMTPREGQVLISNDIQSWAYFEGGLIESVGCFLVYFLVFYNIWGDKGQVSYTPLQVVQLGSKRLEDLTQAETNVIQAASSSYFLAVLIQQAFNLYICKVTLRLPFGKMLFRNMATPIGLAFGTLLCMFFVYPPFMWTTSFATYWVNPGYWLFPMGTGVVLLFYACLRILYIKRRQPTNLNMALPLDLHPTRWSTRSH